MTNMHSRLATTRPKMHSCRAVGLAEFLVETGYQCAPMHNVGQSVLLLITNTLFISVLRRNRRTFNVGL